MCPQAFKPYTGHLFLIRFNDFKEQYQTTKTLGCLIGYIVILSTVREYETGNGKCFLRSSSSNHMLNF